MPTAEPAAAHPVPDTRIVRPPVTGKSAAAFTAKNSADDWRERHRCHRLASDSAELVGVSEVLPQRSCRTWILVAEV